MFLCEPSIKVKDIYRTQKTCSTIFVAFLGTISATYKNSVRVIEMFLTMTVFTFKLF